MLKFWDLESILSGNLGANLNYQTKYNMSFIFNQTHDKLQGDSCNFQSTNSFDRNLSNSLFHKKNR